MNENVQHVFLVGAKSLATLIGWCDGMTAEQREILGAEAQERVRSCYSWQFIADQYEKVFCARLPANAPI